jgi:hypothetical protein
VKLGSDAKEAKGAEPSRPGDKVNKKGSAYRSTNMSQSARAAPVQRLQKARPRGCTHLSPCVSIEQLGDVHLHLLSLQGLAEALRVDANGESSYARNTAKVGGRTQRAQEEHQPSLARGPFLWYGRNASLVVSKHM